MEGKAKVKQSSTRERTKGMKQEEKTEVKETIEKTVEETVEKEKNTWLIGSLTDAPEFLKDNEYIKHGYRINFNNVTEVTKSIFMIHNESVNIWTHLFGAIFIIFLVFYTALFIRSHKDEILNLNFSKFNNELKQMASPILDVFPHFENITQNINAKYETSKHAFADFKDSILNKTHDYFEFIDNRLGVSQGYLNCYKCFEELIEKVKHMKENINSGIINWKERFYNESAVIMETLDHVKVSDLLDDLSKRLNDFSEKIHNMIESDHPSKKIHHLSEVFHEQLISRWPLFVFLASAIICLGSSAIFHWFSAHSEKTNDILARLDYAGISILVAGSCYPPYYYFFYCEPFWRTVYLAFITIFASSVFLYSFEKNFNKPQNRKLRGSLFLTLGISAGIPVIHLMFFTNTVRGFNKSPDLLNWPLGGASYIFGALIYINRIPERFRPGKHDIWGSSHQIFHICVIFGVIFHYFGSLNSFYYRLDSACPAF